MTDETIFSDSSIDQMTFEDCSLTDYYISGNIKTESIRNFPIKFLETSLVELKIENAVVEMPIVLWNVTAKTLHASNVVFESGISFGSFEGHGFFAQDIYIISSDTNQRLDFYNGSIKGELLLKKVGINEQMVIWKSFKVGSWIKMQEIEASHAVSIDFNENFTHLDLGDCWFETSLTIRCDYSRSLKKQVTLSLDGIISGNYIVENIPTLSINLNCINMGNVIFNNVSTKFIIFENMFNFGKVFFNSIERNEKFNMLRIYDSNIGNTEFQNIDFKLFDEVIIAKSDVSSLILTNSPFPKRIQTYSNLSNYGDEKLDEAMYYRESYRQLKVAMGKIDNKYYSLMYKSREMHYQRKETKRIWDKLLLTINFISNNHGIDWQRGIVFTIGCAYASFLVLNKISAHPIFHWNISSSKAEIIQSIGLAADHFLHFISTFPKLDSSLRNDGDWKTDLVILLARIFIGIGIYQTISAFRKYAK
ncbi:MAG: hypothetical protein V4590_03120 [Bacteroidota bacterium]